MKRFLKNILEIILIITTLMLFSNFSVQANQFDYSEEENQKEENNSKIEEIKEREEQVEKIKDETLKEVEKLNIKIDQYQNQIDTLDVEIDETTNKIEETEEKLNKKQEDYEKQEQLLEARLVALYEAGDASYLDFLLSSESLTDLISNYYLATEIASYDTELLDTIQKEKQEIEEAKETLEQAKNDLTTQKASKESASIQLQTSKTNKNNYVAQLNEEEQELEAKKAQLEKDNAQLDIQINSKKAAIEEWRRQQEAARQASNSSSESGESYSGADPSAAGFINPVNSYVTTGMYYSWGGYHGAVDFGAAGVNGMPVYAVADGYVVYTQALTTSYGNHILIAHENGLYTLYAHGQAGSICVSPGETVKQGQQIMNVGSTGNSTGPHLHFEVRTSPGTYSCRVNPMAYLP